MPKHVVGWIIRAGPPEAPDLPRTRRPYARRLAGPALGVFSLLLFLFLAAVLLRALGYQALCTNYTVTSSAAKFWPHDALLGWHHLAGRYLAYLFGGIAELQVTLEAAKDGTRLTPRGSAVG